MPWNVLALSADFFVLAGAVLQVAGTFWIRHLSRKKDLSLPAGGIGVDVHASKDNLDIFGFLSIGVGSVYFILNDVGLSSDSELLLGLCLVQSGILVGFGFESFSALSENSVEILRFPVWPLHMGLFFAFIIGEWMVSILVGVWIASGTLDMATTLPLFLASLALNVFVMKSLDFRTVRTKERPDNSWMFKTGSTNPGRSWTYLLCDSSSSHKRVPSGWH